MARVAWPETPPADTEALDRAAWHQAVLAAEISRVRAVCGGPEADVSDELAEIARIRANPPAGQPCEPLLDALALGFGLTDFERDVLLLVAGSALDPRRPRPSFSYALQAMPGAHWTAVQAHRPLRAAGLLRLPPGPWLDVPLEIDERVLDHLQAAGSLDERLRPYVVEVAVASGSLPPSRAVCAAAMRDVWSDREAAILLHGPVPRDGHDVVALAAAADGRTAWLATADDLPRSPAERDAFVRLWAREAVLDGAVLMVDIDRDDPPATAANVDAVLHRLVGSAVVGATERLPLARVAASVELKRPTREEQAVLWRGLLGSEREANALAATFDLGHSEILDAPPDLLAAKDDPMASARARSVGRTRWQLRGVAERIEVSARWDDLVLSQPTLTQLRRLAAAAAGRIRLEAQGFARSTTRGFGVVALFTGSSGTGKTFAAEVVAHELGLDLHRVDLAGVVSKWVGETEKHLRRIFDAAEQGGTVLLFDEADALFGRRSEVRDSHDRYANVEVAYLLQRMEAYRGLAILTTNARGAIDPAFLRRVRAVVTFPHPGRDEREALWSKAFPPGTPTEELDPKLLANADLTGGDVRSAALSAALVAAGEGSPVRMSHLRDAVAAELAKHDRALTGLESW